MSIYKMSFNECAEKYRESRSLARWPSKKYIWSSLEEFLKCPVVASGIHSILLEDLILDIYLEIKHNSPAYIYFHGNCPRASNFKLPVFSGSNILGSLEVTKIVPSDPVLLLDKSLELSWHAGCSSCNLQETYHLIFSKIIDLAAAPEVVFWGGSGGGFAALYYSYFFPGSTAMVWNPQTKILQYLQDPVNKYLAVAFGTSVEDVSPIPFAIEPDVSRLYCQGYKNRIIYIQNSEDWHVAAHLEPFLAALGADPSPLRSDACNGLVAPDVYLFLGDFSKGHQPPTNVEIHCALQECFSVHGDPAQFNFGKLINKRHNDYPPPKWVVEALLSHRLDYFRPDWPPYTASPRIDTAAPYSIPMSTGLSINAAPDGTVDWDMEFERDLSTNIHELYSLTHVGRLLSAYDDTNDQELLNACIAMLTSFFYFIKNKSSLNLVMTNRGYSASDHSMSVRANVIIKFIQTIAQIDYKANILPLIEDITVHLWDIADIFSDNNNIYPSNHGIMSCFTLAQIANQFKRLKYISDQYLRCANVSLIGLIKTSFDRDGWSNENTVGYHSFILRLLKDYIEYSKKNGLEADDIQMLGEYLSQGEQALAYCVRQDGSIPPIGDSPLYRSGLTSINHSKFFAESGLLIVKDTLLYLSLICGSRSDNHKQVDDSSLTLHYGGEDLIIDGGSYCYDSTDPYRMYLVSCRGHSGVFPASMWDLPAKAYLLHRRYASIVEFTESTDGRLAKARYKLDIDNFECERRIFIDYSGGLVITDRASADNPSTIVQQSFILSPQLRLIEDNGSTFVFEGDKYGIVISQLVLAECTIENGLTDPIVAGWCSINWREKENTYQLRFTQKGRNAYFLTKIQVFEKGMLTANSLSYDLPLPEVMMRLNS